MANFVRNILAILLTLFFIGINVREISARRHSPLLIEDDGSRRNRPAGEFLLFHFFLFVCLSIYSLKSLNIKYIYFSVLFLHLEPRFYINEKLL